MVAGKKITDEKEICNIFNEHFASNPLTIQNSVSSCNIDYTSGIPRNIHSMVSHQVTENEISSCLEKTNKKGSLHKVSRNFLILCGRYLVTHLSELFNLCIKKGIYPNEFKTASITPVHKKGSQHTICNYRPITVLGIMSKLFEGIIYTRLQRFLHRSKVPTNSLYGYR